LGGGHEHRRPCKRSVVIHYFWGISFFNSMNMNNNNDVPIPEWQTLGTELLEGAMRGGSYEEAIRFLNTSGVDPALYILFCSFPQGYTCILNKYPMGMWSVKDVRSLMQAAFVLGTYVRKSVEEVEKLW